MCLLYRKLRRPTYNSAMNNPTDTRAYRNALGRFATGITIITTQVGDSVRGMTCNAFLSISLDPPLVGIAVKHSATMHGYLERSGRYGVSVLAAEQQHLSNHFAGQPQAGPVPFITRADLPLIDGANAHLITKIVQAIPIGDHTLFVGRVEQFHYKDDANPLLYHAGQYALLSM